MVEILQIIQDFLCYGNYDCISQFQQYYYKPMEGLFWLVFFPSVFIIVFIYLLSNKLFGHHRGLKILISVAFFAFIILQGWYHLFIMLGNIWYIALIILGFFWLALYGLRGGIGGGGGGGGQARSFGGGLAGKVMARVIAKATGAEKAELSMVEAQLNLFDSLKPGDRDIGKVSADVAAALQQLWRSIELGGGVPDPTVIRDYNHFVDRYKKICKQKNTSVPHGIGEIKK